MRIDLRSDTVTKPTEAMREAMARAPVGDDVFAEDPVVNELQEFAAEMFGMESALYCSSGTQTNQIAINVHTRPGDEVICSELAHIYVYEGGGMALNSGLSSRLLRADRGIFDVKDVQANINPDDAHYARTTLVCAENTVNKGGGAIYDFDKLKAISEFCRKSNLKFHCDGARLMNAAVAENRSPKDFGKIFDSISLCLSKGLGAPVGSLLLGSKEFMYHAHRRRKTFGGGMRQAGIIAAGGLYALKNNIERLADDHKRAAIMAETLLTTNYVASIMPVDTNIVIFEVREDLDSHKVAGVFREKGIGCFTFGDRMVRLVAHLDFDDNQLDQFNTIVRNIIL
jgi:threonine aldolase